MPTPEEVPVGQNGSVETNRIDARVIIEHKDNDFDDGEPEELSEDEQFERTLKQLSAILDSATLSKLIDVFSKRVDSEPDKQRQDHELRMLSHAMHGRLMASNRIYFLIGLGMSLAFLCTIIIILRADKDTLLPVLTAVVGLLAGAGGGFIFGQSRRET